MKKKKVAPEIEIFWLQLPRSCKLLVTLRDELYEGSWEKILEDFDARLKSKPYILKLVQRIEEDIKYVKLLREFEKKHDVNLNIML